MSCRIGDTTVRCPEGWKSKSARRLRGCAAKRRHPSEHCVIDPKLLRTDLPGVARQLARRGFALDVDAFQKLEDRRKHWQIEADHLRAQRNAHAKAVGMSKGRGEDIAPLIAKGDALTSDLTRAEQELADVQT